MKRNIAKSNSGESVEKRTEGLEQLSVVDLSRRKESATQNVDSEQRRGNEVTYPIAFVLRLRILQIVCGVFNVVMGCVAVIEERAEFNLSLGIPTGCGTVLAAAVSIHTTLNWMGGGASVRGLPSILWVAATSLLTALMIQCCRTISYPSGMSSSEYTRPHFVRDLMLIASIQLILSLVTLTSVAVCTKVDFRTLLKTETALPIWTEEKVETKKTKQLE